MDKKWDFLMAHSEARTRGTNTSVYRPEICGLAAWWQQKHARVEMEPLAVTSQAPESVI